MMEQPRQYNEQRNVRQFAFEPGDGEKVPQFANSWMKKPVPYCSPQMRAMLQSIADGKGRSVPGMRESVVASVFAALRSRGWVNSAGQVTDEGRQWIKQ